MYPWSFSGLKEEVDVCKSQQSTRNKNNSLIYLIPFYNYSLGNMLQTYVEVIFTKSQTVELFLTLSLMLTFHFHPDENHSWGFEKLRPCSSNSCILIFRTLVPPTGYEMHRCSAGEVGRGSVILMAFVKMKRPFNYLFLLFTDFHLESVLTCSDMSATFFFFFTNFWRSLFV